MGLDVVRVPVPAVLVIGHQHMRPDFAYHRDEEVRRLPQVGSPKCVRSRLCARRRPADSCVGHPAVSVPARSTEEAVVGDAELGHRRRQLADAMLAQPVLMLGREMGQLRHQDLALFPERAGDERDMRSLGRVPSHGDAVADRLVVGMRVDEKQAPIG